MKSQFTCPLQGNYYFKWKNSQGQEREIVSYPMDKGDIFQFPLDCLPGSCSGSLIG